ncbi:E3 ubiquitin-protein ligase NLA-like [Bidens hawaiensis]|uniref:E3 ubiquitin-protein ligase NLA-like n=1 Tax=Bidens hawaiensis TaxID=980011 RepID=UPI00404AB165
MKFCKKYEEYMQTHDQNNLPAVGFKNLKKILKRCRRDKSPGCTHPCQVCDGSFFPSLTKEMSMVLGCFNECAQKVVDVHLASGFRKYVMWCTHKLQRNNHGALIQQGNDLVGYALINAIAMRKILKKYDKIHGSNQGEAFRSRVQSMHTEILQSPWLYELIAFHINLTETKGKMGNRAELFERCGIIFDDGKPSLSCHLSHAVTLEIDLTCSVCLDTVFDPVCLTCGHIFCFLCACKSGSVTIVDGLKTTKPTAKCPLCREARVYHGSLHLDELNILLSKSCPKYWEERHKTERAERIRQTKEHWEAQSRSFLGI